MSKRTADDVGYCERGNLLASDMAGKITGATIDVTAGATAGLNNKVVETPFRKVAAT